MKKIFVFILFGLLVAAVLVGVSLNFLGKSKQITETSSSGQAPAWLEVIAGKVFELQTDEKTIKNELATGDNILAGMILKTDVSGKAIIHYPEGSELRLENDTLIKIENGSFDTNSDSLKVRAELVVGRTWSKIIELATPDSEWEVKTSNAVATVRGTAFGMETDVMKKTKIFGSENKVQVSVRDIKTNNLVATDLVVTKDKVVEIDDSVANKVLALKKVGEEKVSSTTIKQFLTERQITGADLKDAWIKESESRDDKIRARILDLNNEGLGRKELRDKLREDVKNDFQDKMKQVKEKLNEKPNIQGETQSLIDKQLIQTDKPKISNDTSKPVVEKTLIQPSKPEPDASNPKPVIENIVPPPKIINPVTQNLSVDFSATKLEVVTKAPSLNVVEGTEIQFLAMAVFSDGSRKDVTSSVNWGIIGYIGKVASGGRFISEIMPEASEYASVPGTVTAVLENAGKPALKGFSQLITVSHKPSNEVPADIGDQ